MLGRIGAIFAFTPTRTSASGKGEGSPVSGRDTATGCEKNRRVEVIVAHPKC
jgi:flagellar motor protein MotB